MVSGGRFPLWGIVGCIWWIVYMLFALRFGWVICGVFVLRCSWAYALCCVLLQSWMDGDKFDLVYQDGFWRRVCWC